VVINTQRCGPGIAPSRGDGDTDDDVCVYVCVRLRDESRVKAREKFCWTSKKEDEAVDEREHEYVYIHRRKMGW